MKRIVKQSGELLSRRLARRKAARAGVSGGVRPERAALGWAEALTRIESCGAPRADYDTLAAVFDERERVELTLVITTINAWNRFAVGFGSVHAVRADGG